MVDTGPSAAVVGLAVFVGRRHRAYVTAGAVVLAMVIEVPVMENPAREEHLAAITGMVLLCAGWRRCVSDGRRRG